METAENKLEFLAQSKLNTIEFESVTPDKNNNWINLTDNDFDSLLPIASKETKAAKTQTQENAIFKLFSLGLVTNRDEWMYDYAPKTLAKKAKFLIDTYNNDLKRLSKFSKLKKLEKLDETIKWTRAVKNDFIKGVAYAYDASKVTDSFYRPYVKKISITIKT